MAPRTIAPACRLTSLVGAALLAVSLAPAAVRAQGAEAGRLDIHGYLTQGYAASDGAAFYGMRSQGSSDFRYAALQFRYDHGQEGLVLQVNHRRLGRSPITDFESNVNLNWAFYEHRSTSGATTIRLGRVPIPRGIYNEQRNIGVLLPFYRVPVIFYDEAAYFSETIDGGVASHTFGSGNPWNVDAHLYAGGWSLLQYDQSGPEYAIGRVRAENAVGTQLWLNTPVDGVRLGGSAQRYKFSAIDEGGFLADRQNVWEVQGSFDATFTRAYLRAESMLQHYETDHYIANYVQLGVKPTPKLWINTQGEYAVERAYQSDEYPRNFDWHKVMGVGLSYQATSSLVLKAEHHWNRGIQVEQHADPANPPSFRYYILSASTSF